MGQQGSPWKALEVVKDMAEAFSQSGAGKAPGRSYFWLPFSPAQHTLSLSPIFQCKPGWGILVSPQKLPTPPSDHREEGKTGENTLFQRFMSCDWNPEAPRCGQLCARGLIRWGFEEPSISGAIC